MNSFEWWLAWRHLKAKKDHAYLSLITYLSVIGVALGGASLIVVLSVMNGFSSDLQEKIISSRAHIEVEAESPEGLKDLSGEISQIDPRIIEVIPVAKDDVMFTKGDRMAGGILKGLNLQNKNFQNQLVKKVDPKGKRPGIYLGRELAAMLGARLGSEISVVSPTETLGPLGMIPKTQTFQVLGYSETGVYEYDAATSYVSLSLAQHFLRYKGNVSHFSVRLKDINVADEVAALINAKSNGRWRAKSWGELNKILFSALKLEKIGMFLILALAILIASFNILATLHIMVREKQKEISIMKAMGSTDRQIRKIFWFEGMMIGSSGTVIGLILGGIACLALKQLQIPMPGIYYISSLPVAPKLTYFLMVGLVSILISYTATLFPASRAAKVNPLQGIQYEK